MNVMRPAPRVRPSRFPRLASICSRDQAAEQGNRECDQRLSVEARHRDNRREGEAGERHEQRRAARDCKAREHVARDAQAETRRAQADDDQADVVKWIRRKR